MPKKSAKPEAKTEKKAEVKPKPMPKPALKSKPTAEAKSKSPAKAAKVEAPPSEDVDAETEVIKKPVKAVVVKEKKQSAKAKAEIAAANESNKKWAELKAKHSDEKPVNYSMTSSIEVNTPVQHKIFGWGYVTKSENDRLEVLFETGTKQLISNYKR